MDLTDGFSRQCREILLGIEAEIVRADVGVIDIHEQAAARALDKL